MPQWSDKNFTLQLPFLRITDPNFPQLPCFGCVSYNVDSFLHTKFSLFTHNIYSFLFFAHAFVSVEAFAYSGVLLRFSCYFTICYLPNLIIYLMKDRQTVSWPLSNQPECWCHLLDKEFLLSQSLLWSMVKT